jgi:hypothetical protein
MVSIILNIIKEEGWFAKIDSSISSHKTKNSIKFLEFPFFENVGSIVLRKL